MKIEILKDSEELGLHDYQEVTRGVFLAEKEGRLVVLQPDDTGLLVELPQ